MRCLRCNRKIKANLSKERGYGPTCYDIIVAETKQNELNLISEMEEHLVIIEDIIQDDDIKTQAVQYVEQEATIENNQAFVKDWAEFEVKDTFPVILKNIIESIRAKISTKTFELLTILKISSHPRRVLTLIKEKNEIIDRVIRPLVGILEPIKNPQMITFA